MDLLLDARGVITSIGTADSNQASGIPRHAAEDLRMPSLAKALRVPKGCNATPNAQHVQQQNISKRHTDQPTALKHKPETRLRTLR